MVAGFDVAVELRVGFLVKRFATTEIRANPCCRHWQTSVAVRAELCGHIGILSFVPFGLRGLAPLRDFLFPRAGARVRACACQSAAGLRDGFSHLDFLGANDVCPSCPVSCGGLVCATYQLLSRLMAAISSVIPTNSAAAFNNSVGLSIFKILYGSFMASLAEMQGKRPADNDNVHSHPVAKSAEAFGKLQFSLLRRRAGNIRLSSQGSLSLH